MKKSILICQSILFVTLSMLFSGCTKEPGHMFTYLGSWNFYYTWLEYSKMLPQYRTGDSTSFIGVIIPGPSDGYITVVFTETNSITLKVEEDGKILNSCIAPEHGFSECSGYFEGDSLLHYNTFSQSAPNEVKIYTTTLIGRKISSNIAKQAPSVTTSPAAGVTMKGAILQGIVNPNFLTTTVNFEFGITSGYGTKISIPADIKGGYIDINESLNISGLTSGTQYHFRITASNSMGTVSGNDMTFTTFKPFDPVTDIDGNVYNTIPVGNQIWMGMNLKTTRFNDGTAIQSVVDNNAWKSLATPGYCWYNNDETANKSIYGAMYNWFAVSKGNICPEGWHVPSDAEWSTLTDYLGGESLAGGKLKETGTTHWLGNNTGATNETDFTSVPGGYRSDYNGLYLILGHVAYLWSSSESDESGAWCRSLDTDYVKIARTRNDKKQGVSVRCLKD